MVTYRNTMNLCESMKAILITLLVVLLGASCATAENQLVERCVNVFQDKQYEIVVMQADLDSAPLWAEDQLNPPLSVRAAIAHARQLSRKVPESNEWKVSTVILKRIGNKDGQWIYVVEFTPYHRETILLGSLKTFKIPVLMNGKTPDLIVK